MRQYGRERLEESSEAPKLRWRHVEYFLGLAQTAEPNLSGPEQGEWLGRLEEEHDNFRAALEWCFKAGEREATEQAYQSNIDNRKSTIAEVGLRLTGALSRFWDIRGYLSEGGAFLRDALAHEGA